MSCGWPILVPCSGFELPMNWFNLGYSPVRPAFAQPSYQTNCRRK
jgi:hypothetical protein